LAIGQVVWPTSLNSSALQKEVNPRSQLERILLEEVSSSSKVHNGVQK
jgi:hypothetical protein